jgi:hypothetical protein
MKNHCNTETQSQTGIPNLARINGKSVTFFNGNWLYRVNFDWTLFLVNLFFFLDAILIIAIWHHFKCVLKKSPGNTLSTPFFPGFGALYGTPLVVYLSSQVAFKH